MIKAFNEQPSKHTERTDDRVKKKERVSICLHEEERKKLTFSIGHFSF